VLIRRTAQAARTPSMAELWEARYLIRMLVQRDLKVRYRHTAVGVGWFVLQPLLLMIVITIGLGFAVSGNLDGLPLPLYLYSGLVIWVYFSSAFPNCAQILVQYRGILSKTYFPRIVLPLVPVIASVVDFAVAATLLAPLMILFGVAPTWRIVLAPFVVIWLALFVLGLGLVASAASARYRDIRHVIPFFTQLMFFTSPIFIFRNVIEGAGGLVFLANPLTGILIAFRWTLFASAAPPAPAEVLVSVIVAMMLVVLGVFYFQHQQATIVDTL